MDSSGWGFVCFPWCLQCMASSVWCFYLCLSITNSVYSIMHPQSWIALVKGLTCVGRWTCTIPAHGRKLEGSLMKAETLHCNENIKHEEAFRLWDILYHRREENPPVRSLISLPIYLFSFILLIYWLSVLIPLSTSTFYYYIFKIVNCIVLYLYFFQVYIGCYAFIISNIFKCSQVWWCMCNHSPWEGTGRLQSVQSDQ